MITKHFKIFLFLLIISINHSIAQVQLKIIGIYKSKGLELFAFDNNHYIGFYYGGIQIGKWNIKDSISISFEQFEKDETFIILGDLNKENLILKQVFEEDLNNFTYPNTHLFDKNIISISIGKLSENYVEIKKVAKIYNFEIDKKYNDFIAYYIESQKHTEPFKIKKGILNLTKEDVLSLNETEEIVKAYKNYGNFPLKGDLVLYFSNHSMYNENTDITRPKKV